MRSSRAGLHDDRPAVSAGGLRRSDGAPNQDASFLPGPIAIPSTTEITPVSPHRFGGERRASGAELSALGAVPQLDISPAARPDKASTGQALPGHAAAEVKDLRERRLDNRSREVGTKRLRPADDQQPVRPSEAAVLARRDVGRAGPTETRTGNDVPDASQAKKRRTVLEGGVIMAEAITEQAMLSKARLADPPPPLKPPRDRSGAALVSAPKLGTTSPSEKLRSPEGRFAEVPLDGLPLPAQRRAGARAALPETNPHPSSRNKRDVAPTGAWATSVSAPKTVGTIPSSRALDAALELEGAAAVGQQSAIQQRSQPDSTHSNATGGLSEQIGMEPAARAERHSPVAMEVDRPGPRRNDSASLTDPWNVETSALDAVLSSVGLPPIRASREVARASSGWQMTRSQAAELARPEKEAIVKLLETDEWAGHLTDEHLAARNLGPPTSFSGSGGALSIEIDEPAQQLIEALQRLEELQAVSNAGDPLIMLNKAKWTKSPRGRMVRYPTLPGRANAPALEVRTQGRYDHSYAKRSPAVRKMIAGPKPPVANPAGSPDPIAN
ncbi:hypothetical protein DFJ74DRAFT_152813 [Hyaloraphidium curvatum]|nr:hypothetical protein DFJ74DRAFT_152813 [Hyaloraphidium curvatum]